MMDTELLDLLRTMNKEKLLLIFQELGERHRSLAIEIEDILDGIENPKNSKTHSHDDEDFYADKLILHRPLPPSVLPYLDPIVCQQQVENYYALLQAGTPPQTIFDDLVRLFQEAETRADQYDYQQALTIYAIGIDVHLATQHEILNPIFDRAIDEFMPVLDMLLSEASSSITSNTDAPTSHLLPTELRQQWLQRLFMLWLKRLDSHQAEEHLPEMLLEVAWSEDVEMLHQLIEHALQPKITTRHSNILDFSRQSRTRILDKFLKELPHP